jgi:peptidylprolyl isomerase
MLTISLCLALAVAGCGGSSDSSSSSTASTATSTETTAGSALTRPKVVVPKGAPPKKLVIKEIKKGTGAVAKPGDEVSVQYVGVDYKTGKEFDASWDRGEPGKGEPFAFSLGAGQVIPGWDKGVAGMKVGGRRELIIPPELAYGAAGSPGAIAPNATLVFVIDLLSVN